MPKIAIFRPPKVNLMKKLNLLAKIDPTSTVFICKLNVEFKKKKKKKSIFRYIQCPKPQKMLKILLYFKKL